VKSAPAPGRVRRRRRRAPALLLALLLLLAGGGYVLGRGETGERMEDPPAPPDLDERVAGLDPCEVPVELLEHVWRGYYPGRSGDVLTIEWEPTQFSGLRHSTPWPYTMNVPVVLYGPGFIRQGVTVDRDVTVADLAPTYAELIGFDEFPSAEREGRPLREALLPEEERNGVPRLILTLVWDGGGDNVLEYFPDAWPNLRDLFERGTWYQNATVGSSPSLTPAIHTNIGTGAFPKTHGITDMHIRIDGEMAPSFHHGSPHNLLIPTLADLWARANDNRPLIGHMARGTFHLGMVGYGAYAEGGNRHIAMFNRIGGTEYLTNEDYYRLPDYMHDQEGLEDAIREVDVRDGEADGMWRGNQLVPDDAFLQLTPVWPIFQTDKLIELLEKEGFGADDVADLFYVNFKAIDLAHHQWNMVEPEARAVLAEQDRQLPRLIEALDRLAGPDGYVLAYTSDHGLTPYPELTGGWAITSAKVVADLEEAFGDPGGEEPVVTAHRGYKIFLDHERLARNGHTPEDVSAFLRDYRVADNVVRRTRARFEEEFTDRADERVYITALTPDELEEALSCARRTQE
jgi:hypothetical protein